MDEQNASGTYLVLVLITFFALVAVTMFAYLELKRYDIDPQNPEEVTNPFKR